LHGRKYLGTNGAGVVVLDLGINYDDVKLFSKSKLLGTYLRKTLKEKAQKIKKDGPLANSLVAISL